jgi:hypothetical protein
MTEESRKDKTMPLIITLIALVAVFFIASHIGKTIKMWDDEIKEMQDGE